MTGLRCSAVVVVVAGGAFGLGCGGATGVRGGAQNAPPPNDVGRTNTQPGVTNMQPAETNEPNPVTRTLHEVEAAEKPGRYSPLAIEYNPLGLFLGGRVSFNVEWAPIEHHVLQVSPHFVHTTANLSTTAGPERQTYSGFGTELGYRYYTGHRGMNGMFIGPSLIVGAYSASLPAGDQGFGNIGVAADVGYQEIFWDHLVVGGGAGIEFLYVTHDFGDLPAGPSTIASTGVKPRLLLQAGFAF